MPAACCGLWGLKPSRGATPMGPDFGNYLMGIVGEGVLARSLRDITNVFAQFLSKGRAPDYPHITVVIPERCDATQATATRYIARLFEATGAEIIPCIAPDALGAEAHILAGQILAVSLAEWLDAYEIADVEISRLAAANASAWPRHDRRAGLRA